MRVPRVRFTVRRMMVGVVFAALIVSASMELVRLRKVVIRYRQAALAMARAERNAHDQAAFYRKQEIQGHARTFGMSTIELNFPNQFKPLPRLGDQSKVWESKAIRFAQERATRERVATHPWEAAR